MSRFITNKAGSLFTVGRVQTAVLSAIDERCRNIKNFVPEKYFEIYGEFNPPAGTKIKGLYVDSDGNTKLKDASLASFRIKQIY